MRLREDLVLGRMYGGLEAKVWDEDLLGQPVTVYGTIYIPQLNTEWYRIKESSYTFSREMLCE